MHGSGKKCYELFIKAKDSSLDFSQDLDSYKEFLKECMNALGKREIRYIKEILWTVQNLGFLTA